MTTLTAPPDKNLESYANESNTVVSGPRTINGLGYDDALKFSNCRNVDVSGLTINGGREDCIDINRGTGYWLHDLTLAPTGKFAVTIKGGVLGAYLEDIVIHGKGSEVDIDLGNWSDQSQERTSVVTLDNVRRHDGTPVIVRVLHSSMPVVLNSRVKILDRRWMAYFQRLWKRWTSKL